MTGDMRLETVRLAEVILPAQVRRCVDEEALEGLAASIKANGLLQPPLCSKDEQGRLSCVFGARRVRAMKLLGWKEGPVFVVSSTMEAGEVLTRQLVENLQRENVDPLSEAEGIAELARVAGLTGEQVAAALGKAPAFVTRRLALLKLPEPLREQVRSGRIAADAGYMLARVADPAEQAALGADVACGKLKREDLARRLRRVKNAEAAQHSKTSRVTAKLPEGTISVTAVDLSLEKLIDVLEAAVARARKARAQRLTLGTFVKALRDQAVA
ncbi:MAG: ParB/RepB/Spo0J family partition protein [Dehalococcoidia bacterium]